VVIEIAKTATAIRIVRDFIFTPVGLTIEWDEDVPVAAVRQGDSGRIVPNLCRNWPDRGDPATYSYITMTLVPTLTRS
jgi:hypothetical protein